ncbi:hypothetical protein SAMN05421754_10496 [Nitrosomonas sp. Nm58]|nr:hypothetical protein SAMN05421754_10496 [Nitrosomonas sp. Nm58]
MSVRSQIVPELTIISTAFPPRLRAGLRRFRCSLKDSRKKVSSASVIPDNTDTLSATNPFRNRCRKQRCRRRVDDAALSRFFDSLILFYRLCIIQPLFFLAKPCRLRAFQRVESVTAMIAPAALKTIRHPMSHASRCMTMRALPLISNSFLDKVVARRLANQGALPLRRR